METHIGVGVGKYIEKEFANAKDFGKELYKANKEEYPPKPEISDKEKRKLGIKEERMSFKQWIS